MVDAKNFYGLFRAQIIQLSHHETPKTKDDSIKIFTSLYVANHFDSNETHKGIGIMFWLYIHD